MLQRSVVCCSVLQCVAAATMCGNLSNRRQQCLQCVEALCNVLQSVAACFSVLQCVAVRCSALQCVAARSCHLHTDAHGKRWQQCAGVCCSELQRVAVPIKSCND